MLRFEVGKNGSSKVKCSSYNSKILISGPSEMGTLDQYVFYRFVSVDWEHETVVCVRPKDLCFYPETHVGVHVELWMLLH